MRSKPLRSFVSVDGGIELELKRSLGEGAKIIGGLSSFWRNREVTIDANVEIVESVMVPTILYGSE